MDATLKLVETMAGNKANATLTLPNGAARSVPFSEVIRSFQPMVRLAALFSKEWALSYTPTSFTIYHSYPFVAYYFTIPQLLTSGHWPALATVFPPGKPPPSLPPEMDWYQAAFTKVSFREVHRLHNWFSWLNY